MSEPVAPITRSEAVVTGHDDSKTLLGFWIYLMTDCVLFGSLFASYAVLHNSTYGGASGKDLFSLPFVLAETILLLTSSYTMGLAVLGLRHRNRAQVLTWLGISFLLGAAFLTMELTEFTHLAAEGHGWTVSAFLSAFFTLVGTHGLHITVGLLWIAVTMWRLSRQGITVTSERRLALLSLFWHFLDVIWIFIFTIVYLMGVI